MKHFLYLILILAALCPLRVEAAEIVLTLDEAIVRARSNSVEAAGALARLKSAYWQWRTYRADRLPEVKFNATLPAYANRYSSYMNSNGEYSFVANRYLQATGELAVSQNIPLTGGKVSVISSLDFVRQFGKEARNDFMTIPAAVSLSQPLFGVNHLRWSQRIEPQRYREACAEFLSASEDVALQAVSLYFSLILSRENLTIAEQNLTVAERLYGVAQEKRTMGSISQNDLLQMEINLLDARSAVSECTSTLKSDMFALRTFLDYDGDTEIVTVLPDSVPQTAIGYEQALELARANNKFATSMRRRQLEADYEVAKAKANLREINLFAQVGYTGSDSRADEAYRRLRGNQMVEVGVSIPILDWGRRRGKVKVAESNRRVVESQLRQESQNFNQDLYVLVERFGNQQQQLDFAQRTAEIANRRYDTNVSTFLIGKISTLDLNDSQQRKDESRRNYITQLFRFWTYWYQIRSITLYDFQHQSDILADIERLVK